MSFLSNGDMKIQSKVKNFASKIESLAFCYLSQQNETFRKEREVKHKLG